MKINRLFEIVYLLLNKKQTTAKELAEHFEVSTRTILRDLETLSASGIPVYTTQGKGGGISILNQNILNKTALSEEDQNQIIFALQSLSPTLHIDSGDTLSRLRALFDKNDADWIEVDFSRWGNMGTDKDQFEVLKQAIIEMQAVEFGYPSSGGEIVDRKVYPLRLVFKSKGWYIQSYCLLKKEYRTFKLNRMQSVKALEEHFFRKDFSPPPIESMSSPPESLIDIKLEFIPQMGYRVYDQFHPESIVKNPDGSFAVSIQMPEDFWLYGYLLSFGSTVKVLEPERIKGKLLEEILKLKDYYTG